MSGLKRKEKLTEKDTVDRDMDETHEEADESHNGEANGSGGGDLEEFYRMNSMVGTKTDVRDRWETITRQRNRRSKMKAIENVPFLSGLLHRRTRRTESTMKPWRGSLTLLAASMVRICESRKRGKKMRSRKVAEMVDGSGNGSRKRQRE